MYSMISNRYEYFSALAWCLVYPFTGCIHYGRGGIIMKSRKIALAGVIAVCIVTIASGALAADQKRDRKRDGTCRAHIVKVVEGL